MRQLKDCLNPQGQPDDEKYVAERRTISRELLVPVNTAKAVDHYLLCLRVRKGLRYLVNYVLIPFHYSRSQESIFLDSHFAGTNEAGHDPILAGSCAKPTPVVAIRIEK